MEQESTGSSDRIRLAHVPPFRLGEVEVHPATRQIIRAGRSETLEPRIMQVLVALAQAKGAILTRDELVERCWDGLIVGDNAIHRAVSRVRDLGLTFGGGAFQLETITKVGYRMIVHGSDARPPADDSSPAPSRAPWPTRRLAIGGGIAAAGALAGGLLWIQPWRHRPLPEAQELFRRGELAQRAGLPDQTRQAVSFYERAVQIDPLYADAWGALALAYRHILEGHAEAEMGSLPARLQSAARRALELDPDNADAQLALVLVKRSSFI